MLDYLDRGDPGNPSLLLLHAGGMTRGEWDPFLRAWEAHFRILAPSAPGHGASPRERDITIPALAEATFELLDALGIQRTHIVGSSMGGATALRMALARPQRVGRLVVYRSGYRSNPKVRHALERLASPEIWDGWGLTAWMEREHAPQGGPDAWKDVIRSVARAFDPSLAEASLTIDDLRQIASPVLLITGDRDDLVPFDDVVEMYRALPDSGLWTVPRAGHLMGMETWRSAAFGSEILRFLREEMRP